MKKNVRILVLTFIALFFISTTGVTIYKHYCQHDGVFYRFFVDVKHKCETEEITKVENQHDCCLIVPENENNQNIQEECCAEDVVFYQIDTDLVTHHVSSDWLVSPMFFTSPNPVLASIPTLLEKKPVANSPPYVLTTPKRLAVFQIYLI